MIAAAKSDGKPSGNFGCYGALIGVAWAAAARPDRVLVASHLVLVASRFGHTRLVRRFRKSMRTNWVKLFGLAKYAFPRVIAVIRLTKSTR